jgi:hypothetical protein
MTPVMCGENGKALCARCLYTRGYKATLMIQIDPIRVECLLRIIQVTVECCRLLRYHLSHWDGKIQPPAVSGLLRWRTIRVGKESRSRPTTATPLPRATEWD